MAAGLEAFLAAAQVQWPGRVRLQVPLSSVGRWRIGGLAAAVVEPVGVGEVTETMRLLHRYDTPFTVVGSGSNILFDDDGYDGVLVRIGAGLRDMTIGRDGAVEALAGLWVPRFVARTIKAGLAGCVHAIGIPGTLGGLLAMNGGSQRKGIGDHLVDLTVVGATGALATMSRAECRFGYRRSVLQDGGSIIVSARFALPAGDVAAMRREALAILRDRKAKFPRTLPHCGSVFLSDPALYETVGPPGRAIEEAGLKGVRLGGAQISPVHANFIVNLGDARSSDVLRLIRIARIEVEARTGVGLRCEVKHLARDGRLRPADSAAMELPA